VPPTRPALLGVPAAALALVGALAGSAAAGPMEPRGKIVTVVHSPPDQVPSLGPRNAPVTVEFFCDLGDGSSSGVIHSLLVKLLERHPRRLRILYRLVTSGEQSNAHLEAALEAFTQGRFREFVDEMYGDSMRSPRVADLPEVAAHAGVDRARVEQALEDGRHSAAVLASHYYRKRMRVRRTPGLLFNGALYDRRPRTIDELEALYDEAYARAAALRDQGVPPGEIYRRLLAQVAAEQPEPIIGAGAVDGLGPGERPPLGSPPLVRVRLDRGGWSRGPAAAPVTIVFLCNFQTRNCGETAEMLDQISAAYPDEVRVVFRHFDDPSDRRQDRARDLYRAALCADRQGQFWSFYQLATRQARQGASEPMSNLALARELELDSSALSRCMRARPRAGALEAGRRLAVRAGVHHTPSIVVGGRLYTGTKSFDEMAALVDRELAPGVLGRIAPE
jgi:protein-disulfide isomerase